VYLPARRSSYVAMQQINLEQILSFALPD